MAKPPGEWLTQANYDMDTAAYMFKGGRYMYTVFMCHLSLEKALKGHYAEKLGKEPPKTHNLLYLIEKDETEVTGGPARFYFHAKQGERSDAVSG